jgi:preprotein translocase subunit YajC
LSILATAAHVLISLSSLVAQATSGPSLTTGPAGATQEAPWWARKETSSFLPLIVMVGLMFLLIFRSNKSKDKQRTKMLESLKRGDRIQTIGGILGTVVELRENGNEIVVKVDENSNTKIRFSRSAIHRVQDEDGTASK